MEHCTHQQKWAVNLNIRKILVYFKTMGDLNGGTKHFVTVTKSHIIVDSSLFTFYIKILENKFPVQV